MLLVLALAALATPQDWVPMRWIGTEPASLELLNETPVNCLLLERSQWSPALLDAAASRGIATLAVLRPGDPVEPPRGVSGVVFEGDWKAPLPEVKAPVRVELLPRSQLRFDSPAPIIGTFQAMWPGIRVEEEGKAHAAASGGPWIDTNAGFLRFARAASNATVWVANTPPAKAIVTPERYLQVMSDAAMMGARWVIALDSDFAARLLKREAQALGAWKRITGELAWWESHKQWRSYRPVGQLALIQDVETGALYSGGVLDMIAVKHTPVLPVPRGKLGQDAAITGAKMAVNVDPSALTPEQAEALRKFTRSGGTVLNGPPDWKFPPMTAGSITLAESEIKKLDEIWKELNAMTGRRNLGARLFNVSSMLSNLLRSPDGKQTVLHLVNYSGYPVENVTAHVLGSFKSARLIGPGILEQKLDVFEVEEGAGTGIEVPQVGVTATVILEP